MKTQAAQKPQVAVAALSLAIQSEIGSVPSEIQLTPAGYFSAKDGRPHDVPNRQWFINELIANKLIHLASQSQNEFVIDFEHQTLLKEKNGQPAPAAGWFKNLEWREDGLWAVDVKWTDQAAQMIASGQYRYISPVFHYNKADGSVYKMVMAAITNDPAVDGMQSLASLTSEEITQLFTDNPEENEPMKWSQLLAMLGLPEDATQEQAMSALTAIQNENKTLGEENTALTQKLDESDGKVVALTNQVENPDPEKFVSVSVMEELQTQVAALTNNQAAATVEQTVDQAIGAGKLTPAQKQWAIDLGNQNMASLTRYIDSATPIAALSNQQADGSNPSTDADNNTAALTADQQQIRAAFGHTAEELAAV